MSQREKFKVIFEDRFFLVVDKPAGLIVNRSETARAETLQGYLEEYFDYKVSDGPGGRAGIVHRLDKETSGLLVVAKSEEVMQNLQAQFKNRQVEKVYLALVHGFTKENFTTTLSLARSKANRLRYAVSDSGREAETNFSTLKYLRLKPDIAGPLKKRMSKDFWNSYDKFSLVEAYPKTGRTHQIRVHLHSVFSPIVGDEIYGGRKFLRVDKLWSERMFLHAARIKFTHPDTKEKVEFESMLPQQLNKILSDLDVVEV